MEQYTDKQYAERLKNNAHFAPIFAIKNPLVQYESITSLVNEPARLASISQGEEFFKNYLFPYWLQKTNAQLQQPEIFAVSVASFQTREYDAAFLKEEGFPVDEPVTLHFRFTRGEANDERPAETKAFQVADMIRAFSVDPAGVAKEIDIWNRLG